MEVPLASVDSPLDDCALLELLETFSADDIADVVSSVDTEALRRADVVDSVDSIGVVQQQQQQQQQQQIVRKRRVRPPQTSATRRSDPNKARNERKQELLYLHKKVDELEHQLRTLRERTAAAGANDPHRHHLALTDSVDSSFYGSDGDPRGETQLLSRRTTQSTSTNAAAARVWHELIERQRALRARSERENIRLRLVLETQLKLARSLEKLLLRPGAAKELERCISHQTPRSYIRDNSSNNRQFAPVHVATAALPTLGPFDSLLAGAARARTEIDAVFAATGLAHCGAEAFRDARVQRDSHSGRVCMELVASKALPFALAATRDVVWHHFVFGKETVPHRYHTDHAPKVFLPTMTSYLKSFGLEVHANHKSASFQIKQVIQQHAERDDRVVIVWQAAIDPIAFSEAPLPRDVGIIETGYVLVQRLAPDALETLPIGNTGNTANCDSGDDSNSLTLLQMCHVITPATTTRADDASSSDSDSAFFRVGALTDFVLSATAANLTTSYDTIEDALLEQAMRQQRDGPRSQST